MYPTNRTLERILKKANQAHGLSSSIRALHPYSMLSDEEVYFLEMLCSLLPHEVRVAELGCYVGGTTSLFGEATPPSSIVEVYDLFEHNDASRGRLKSDPLFENKSFFEIWRRNTSACKNKIVLNKDDLNNSYRTHSEPLDIVYVDIVKHSSLINLLLPFYSRLKIGGFLLQQDYFHWQSPWLVYQMEYLKEYFELIGDVGYNMTVYRKVKSLDEYAIRDYSSFETQRVFSLFDSAISRYAASKAGMLRVSKLRMAMELEPRLTPQIRSDIEAQHSGSPRVMRYLNALDAAKDDLKVMW